MKAIVAYFIKHICIRRRKMERALSARRAFTLVELMIVVVIVAILALVFVPLYSEHTAVNRMKKGVIGAGIIRTAAQSFLASHDGKFPTLLPTLADLKLHGVLDEQYIYYTFIPVSGTANYTIKVEVHNSNLTYIIDQAGKESGAFETGK